jgi:hypothetical protein
MWRVEPRELLSRWVYSDQAILARRICGERRAVVTADIDDKVVIFEDIPVGDLRR